jgi:hypothetical protein
LSASLPLPIAPAPCPFTVTVNPPRIPVLTYFVHGNSVGWAKERFSALQVFEERTKHDQQLLARREIFLQPHPGAGPSVQIPAIMFDVMTGAAARFILVVLAFTSSTSCFNSSRF